MSSVQAPAHLKWDVFMTPGIPIVTNDMPPGVKEVYFQAIASTLIPGMQDAVLVDAFMTVKQANDLADWVAASGKNLTTISFICFYILDVCVRVFFACFIIVLNALENCVYFIYVNLVRLFLNYIDVLSKSLY